MNRENLNDRAVSEVFGVMLILTITLIVACIVATFVCGFSFDAKRTQYLQILSLQICTWMNRMNPAHISCSIT